MFFWIRELMGWLLMLAGGFIIWQGVTLLLGVEPKHIEGAFLCGTGVMVMRLGTFLVRVSTAARIVTAVPTASPAKDGK